MLCRLLSLSAVALLLGVAPGGVRAGERASKDIVDTAVSAGQFETLVTAVKAAGLVDTLKGEGPFTVFAPTDEAFAKLGKETINEVLKDKKKLTQILTYHVVPGNVLARDAIKLAGKGAKTVQGQEIGISVKDNKVMLNGQATVIKANIRCSNGVIHVIDQVLLPTTR
jgi:uncharacterized surface protein with fasciclin (FAS1) repeats